MRRRWRPAARTTRSTCSTPPAGASFTRSAPTRTGFWQRCSAWIRSASSRWAATAPPSWWTRKKDIIVIGGEDRIPYLYMMDRPRNLKVGEEATLIRKLEAQEGAIFALDWSPDGTRIAVAGAGAHVNLYDAESGAKLASCAGHSA